MNISDFKNIDDSKNNIKSVFWPYFWAQNYNSENNKNVLFLGSDFYNLGSEINTAEFIIKNNLCLDFIRNNYRGKLYYKPHPAEKEELKALNLDGFEIIAGTETAEFFLWKNNYHINHCFSIASTSSIAAYNLGYNSYLFYKYLENCFKNETKSYLANYFKGLPKSALVTNLTSPLEEDRIIPPKDEVLEQALKDMLADSAGDVWILVSETKFVIAIIAVANLVKKLSPNRNVNLIISQHHRWKNLNLGDIKGFYKNTYVYPRLFYSLQPSRLISSIRTAFKIMRLPVKKEDIILGFSPYEFIENCFISYHKSNKKGVFIDKGVFDLHFNIRSQAHLGDKEFKFDKASFFYNKFFEPLLGLHKTIFVRYGEGIDHYISRFEEPVNLIYDQVFVLNNHLDN